MNGGFADIVVRENDILSFVRHAFLIRLSFLDFEGSKPPDSIHFRVRDLVFRRVRIALYVLVLAFLGAVYFLTPVSAPLPIEAQQVWKHRQNTIDSAISAFRSGYKGVELDLTFLNGRLLVAHDPTEYEKAIPFVDYVAEIKSQIERPMFWIDIKNINAFNEKKITDELLSLELPDQLIAESPRPMFMFRLCSSGMTCSVWAKGTDRWNNRVWYRWWINLLSNYGSVASVSIDYRYYDKVKTIVSPEFPKLLYTFPPGSNLSPYQPETDVRILLTD